MTRIDLRPALLLALVLAGGCDRGSRDGPVSVSVVGATPALAEPDDGPIPLPSRVLLASVAEGLVAFDAAGQVEPALAERWMVTDDGLSYIFRLRDAWWPDGEPVTARQVERALRRALSRSSDNALKPAIEAVASISAVTPRILEVRLRTARPPLLELLAQPEFALVGRGGGAGPFRVAARGAGPLRLEPAVAPDLTEEERAAVVLPSPISLSGARAAVAVARFMGGEAELVLGGTLLDLPVAYAAAPSRQELRFDPARGLVALQLLRAEGVLAEPSNRQALAMAIDRSRLPAVFSAPDWQTAEQVLPEAYRSAAAPAVPAWATVAAGDRRAVARAHIARWVEGNGPIRPIRIAMPAGPGATILFGLLAEDLARVGLPVERVAEGTEADLRLVDAVAPAGSAIWYLLALGCPADAYCDADVRTALSEATGATSLATRGPALAAADRALADTATLIPLARPLRWSLVSPRLGAFTPNAHAVHPLDQLVRRR